MLEKLLSPCCSATIDVSLADGILVGSCSVCCKNVIRINPHTGVQEWLDGKSPWTNNTLRAISNES